MYEGDCRICGLVGLVNPDDRCFVCYNTQSPHGFSIRIWLTPK